MNNSDYLDLISALNYSYNFLGSNIAMILRKLEEFNGSETLSACTAWNSIQYVIMGDDNERLPYPIADYKIFTDYVSHKPPKDVEQVHIRFTNHEGDGFLETEINLSELRWGASCFKKSGFYDIAILDCRSKLLIRSEFKSRSNQEFLSMFLMNSMYHSQYVLGLRNEKAPIVQGDCCCHCP